MNTPAVLVAKESPALSEAQRIVNVFVAPSKTMADLRRQANWLVPWLLMSIVSISFVFTMEKRIGWDLIVRTQIEKSSSAEAFDRLSPAEQWQRLDSDIRITKYSAYLIPVLSVLWFALLAAALVAIFRFALGTGITYGRTLAIVVYGSLPALLERLLAIITLCFADPEGFDLRNPIASGPAQWIDLATGGDFAAHRFLYSVLNSFDLFALWMVLLIAIGISENAQVKRGTAFATIFGGFFVLKLISAGLGF
jgi:hypothetical protein